MKMWKGNGNTTTIPLTLKGNFTSEMDKCELNAVGLSDVRWPRKGEIVSGNYTMFYSGGVKACSSVDE